jgi:hypothetical protein
MISCVPYMLLQGIFSGPTLCRSIAVGGHVRGMCPIPVSELLTGALHEAPPAGDGALPTITASPSSTPT